MEVTQLDECDPIKKVSDLGISKTVSGKKLDGDMPANPCGLIAKSFFNDTFSLKRDNKEVTLNEKGIAWESDIKHKFRNLENPPQGTWEDWQWLDVTNEHFIVWMRTAGLPNFRKLYGRYDDGLEPGNYEMTINNNYDVSSYDGKKRFVLSTSNTFGGKNFFMAGCYLVMGASSFTFGLIYFVNYLRKRNRRLE